MKKWKFDKKIANTSFKNDPPPNWKATPPPLKSEAPIQDIIPWKNMWLSSLNIFEENQLYEIKRNI